MPAADARDFLRALVLFITVVTVVTVVAVVAVLLSGLVSALLS